VTGKQDKEKAKGRQKSELFAHSGGFEVKNAKNPYLVWCATKNNTGFINISISIILSIFIENQCLSPNPFIF
jgi:hypothetical protein